MSYILVFFLCFSCLFSEVRCLEGSAQSHLYVNVMRMNSITQGRMEKRGKEVFMLRTNSWNLDDDVTLAEIALKHIREGSYELKAFSEVGERLGRTTTECLVRWNCTVRGLYEEAVKSAKAERIQYT